MPRVALLDPTEDSGEGEQSSERSDAGTSIVQEVFGFVKKNYPERSGGRTAIGERGAGKGAVALVPASALEKRFLPDSGAGSQLPSSREPVLVPAFCHLDPFTILPKPTHNFVEPEIEGRRIVLGPVIDGKVRVPVDSAMYQSLRIFECLA